MTKTEQSIATRDPWPHTVAASYAQCLVEVAGRQGIKSDALLHRAGLNVDELQPPSRRLPLASMLKLFEAAMQMTGDELIGLHMGQQVQPRTFNALGYAAMSCATLGEAIAMIPRYESLVYDGGTTHIHQDDETVTVSWQSGLPQHLEYRPLNEVIVAGWLSFGRWIVNDVGELHEVRFRHSAPADTEEYHRFFRCPIRFNCEDNALCGPIEFTRLPLIQQDGELRSLMERQANSLLSRIHARQNLAPQVMRHIRENMPKQTPQISNIATLMHMSERNLRRKLQAEGTSFKNLLNHVRQEMAERYLQETELSMLEIALLLGFSEQSSFTSAFRQWLGTSPSEYRRARP